MKKERFRDKENKNKRKQKYTKTRIERVIKDSSTINSLALWRGLCGEFSFQNMQVQASEKSLKSFALQNMQFS